MRAFYLAQVGRPAQFNASKERDLKIMLTTGQWVSPPLNTRRVSSVSVNGCALNEVESA